MKTKILLILCLFSVGYSTHNVYDSAYIQKSVNIGKSLYIKTTPPDTATKYFLTKGNGTDSNKVKRTVVAAGTGITITQSNDTLRVSEYQPPEIVSYTNNQATHYAGETVTDVTTSWTLSGSAITSQTHTDYTPALSDRSHAFTGLSLTVDKTYKLWITDGITPDSAYTYVRFYIATFYGTSANSAPTESDIEAGTTTWETQSSGNRAQSSVNITGGSNYIFYAYPSSWGDINLYINGFLSNWNITTVSVTNAYGDTRDYYVFTSPTTIVAIVALSAVAK